MEEDRKEEEVVEEEKETTKEEKEESVEEKKEEPVEEEKEELEDTQVIIKQEPPKKKKTGVKVVVVILILILIVILCYAAFMNFKPTKKVVKNESKEYESELRLSGNGLEDFDLYFMKLENNKKNSVYSPLSIKYALEMLAEGAKGETKSQLDAVIGDYKAKSYPNSQHMSFANAMFIRNSFKDAVKEEYTNNLKEKYGAEVQYADFSSAKPMNDWVSNKTFNLINDLFTDDAVSQENFELVNALAIDMNWNNRIQAASAPLPEGMDQMFYSVNYIHEKYSDFVPYIEDENYPALKFNGVDNYKSVKVAASFNHYDIIKDKGEDNIRKTVTEDYQKYLKENPDEVEVCPTVEEYVTE